MKELLEQIEVKIAFLERANAELSDVVWRQERELEQLRERVATLVERLDSSAAPDRPYTPEEEKPPHY